ncbi:hypothetical protein Tco_1226133 [Tanacetum coccineum]
MICLEGCFNLATALEEILFQVIVGLEFNHDVLKNHHEYAIIALYADLPRKCKTCDLWFKMQEEHKSYGLARDEEQSIEKPGKTLRADVVPGFLLPPENVVEKKDDEELSVPTDEDQNACELCGEPYMHELVATLPNLDIYTLLHQQDQSVTRNEANPILNINYEKTENKDIEKHRNRFTLAQLLS